MDEGAAELNGHKEKKRRLSDVRNGEKKSKREKSGVANASDPASKDDAMIAQMLIAPTEGEQSDTDYVDVPDLAAQPTKILVQASGKKSVDGQYTKLHRSSRGRPCYRQLGKEKPMYLYWRSKWRIGVVLGGDKCVCILLKDVAGISCPVEPYNSIWKVAGKHTSDKSERLAMRILDLAVHEQATAQFVTRFTKDSGSEKERDEEEQESSSSAACASDSSSESSLGAEAAAAAAGAAKAIEFESRLRDKLKSLEAHAIGGTIGNMRSSLIDRQDSDLFRITGMSKQKFEEFMTNLRTELVVARPRQPKVIAAPLEDVNEMAPMTPPKLKNCQAVAAFFHPSHRIAKPGHGSFKSTASRNGFRRHMNIQFRLDPSTKEALASVFVIESHRPLYTELWFSSPGSRVTCEWCPTVLAYHQGVMTGGDNMSQFSQDIFLCGQCAGQEP